MPAPADTPSRPRSHRPRQRWERYTPGQHAVWATLYARRLATLAGTGATAVLSGIERIGLEPDRIPDLADVNRRLAPLTGWRAVPTAGFEPVSEFFASLARRRFPTTITIRPADRLDYLPEPDIFHDVFGHVPLHADPVFARVLAAFGRLGLGLRSEAATTALSRLFWFTVEFGLIREGGAVRIYGSGLVASAADARNALSERAERREFRLAGVLAEPFAIDRLQDVLFVLESFEQLEDAVDEAGRLLEAVG